MKRQKPRFETVPLADVPQTAIAEKPAEKIADKSEPYAVRIEDRKAFGFAQLVSEAEGE